MSLNAKKLPKKNSGVRQEPLENGTYPARVVQVIDLGVQPQKPYQGKEKPPVHSIMLTYELLDEFCVDKDGNLMEDKPRWISESFPFNNLTADKAKSTKRYYALDPNEDHEGDFTKLTGTPCMITVVQNARGDEIYANVGNVAPMRPKEAAKAPELVNPAVVFALDDPDKDTFEALPDWVQEKIKGNLGFKGSALEAVLNGKPVVKDAPVAEAEEEEEAEEENNDNW